MEFNANSDYTLTRYYYAKDEVELMLVTKILNNNVKEAYIWAFEYYYSGFDIYNLLWKIYFDFYYELNSKMEDYIFKKNKEFISYNNVMDLDNELSKLNMNDENIDIDLSNLKLDDAKLNDNAKEKKIIKNIASVIRNMARCEKSLNSFMIRQTLAIVQPKVLYKGRKPYWIKIYAKKYENFIYSLYKRHVNNICYYLKELLYDNGNYDEQKTIIEIRDIMIDYMYNLKWLIQDDINIYNKRWSDFINIVNDRRLWVQYLIAFICRLFVERDVLKENTEMLYVTPNNDDIKMIYNIYCIDAISVDCRDILKHKRYVELDESIGYFQLERFGLLECEDFDSFYRNIRYYGEYYAAKCPYWNEKIKSFGGELCNNSGKIIFQNETDKEKYYEHYCYDFEDQPKELLMMSHKPIEKLNCFEWLESLSAANKLLINVSDFKDELVLVY